MNSRSGSKRKGWKASSMYLPEGDALALEALCELEGETLASIMRHALREYGAKLAKRHGTTWLEFRESHGTAGHHA